MDTADRAARIEAGQSALADMLTSFLREQRLPGGAAGVVCGDRLAWTAGAGYADLATRRPVDPGAVFGIASVTKTLTGTAVLRLRDAGRLDLDDPAVRWLPELRSMVNPFGPIEAVTIGRMLSHESGLAAEPPGTDWAGPVYCGEPAATLGRAAQIRLTAPPGGRHQYSDLAYQLLGEIVTRAAGLPFPRYLREAVLDPLGMTATAFRPLPGDLAGRRATGYDWRGLSDDLSPAADLPPVWAEGGLWSCVPDLARWISFQLRAYREPDAIGPVLAGASLRQMHAPRYLVDDQWSQAWGISWCATRRPERTWIGHAGGIPGFTSAICFDPASGVGAVVLLNGTTASAALAMDLAAHARDLAREPAPALTPAGPVPDAYRPLLGLYARAGLGGWILRLEWRDGTLTWTTADAPSWRLDLGTTPDPDVFTIGKDPAGSGGTVRFGRLADGRVASAFLFDATWARLDPVSA